MPRSAWGIDIGDGTLKAVRIKAEGRNLRVVRVVEIPYLDPFLKQKTLPTSLDRRAIAALLQFGSTVKISDMDRVAVGFPSFKAMEGVMEMPRVDDSQKEPLIQYETASSMEAPVRDLALHFRHHGYSSNDMERILYHVVRREELDFFLHSLSESGIPYDLVASPGAALMKMSELGGVVHSRFLIVSLGFSTAVLVAVRKHDFWTRCIPLSLPVAPGKTVEVARDTVSEISEILANEIGSFLNMVFPNGSFQPAKILISGEGARIPPLINALDFSLPSSVEVLRPSSRLKVDPTFRSDPSEKTIQSMGKAIGLAAGALDDSPYFCPLAEPVSERRVLRRLPVLVYLAGLVFLMIIGMGIVETIRSSRIQALDGAFAELPATDRASELRELLARKGCLEKEVRMLNEAQDARTRFIKIGKLLSRFETESPQRSLGDFHMTELEMDLGANNLLKSRIGTRKGSEEEIRIELIALFQTVCDGPRLSGPYPAEEETPPKGMAPLVMYEIDGALK